MIDRHLLIRQSLLPLLAEQAQSSVIVATSYQPASEGMVNGPTLYFFQLPTVGNYGWQSHTTTYDAETEIFTRTEEQHKREAFQMTALNDTGAGIEPVELCNLANLLIGSEKFRALLRVEKVGIERITQVRAPYGVNDRDRYMLSPSFDFTLTYSSRIIQTAQFISRAEFHTIRV